MVIIKQGEDYRKILKLQYADTGQPVYATGIIAACTLRDKAGGTVYAKATCTVISNYVTIEILFSAVKTASIPAGNYGYDVWIKDSSGHHCIYTTDVQVVPPYTDYTDLDE